MHMLVPSPDPTGMQLRVGRSMGGGEEWIWSRMIQQTAWSLEPFCHEGSGAKCCSPVADILAGRGKYEHMVRGTDDLCPSTSYLLLSDGAPGIHTYTFKAHMFSNNAIYVQQNAHMQPPTTWLLQEGTETFTSCMWKAKLNSYNNRSPEQLHWYKHYQHIPSISQHAVAIQE